MPSPKELLFEDDVVQGFVDADYQLLDQSGFDLDLGLDPQVLADFVEATQPGEWAKYVKQKTDAVDALAKTVSEHIKKRGYIPVLRSDCLLYTSPSPRDS